MEHLTGIITGSDTPIVDSQQSQIKGLVGESIADRSVWMVESQYPLFRTYNHKEFDCNKMIVLVRDPFQLILSAAHKTLTQSSG
jgi:hypothetical protein